MKVLEFLEKVKPQLQYTDRHYDMFVSGDAKNKKDGIMPDTFYTYEAEHRIVFTSGCKCPQTAVDMYLLMYRYTKMNECFGDYDVMYDDGEETSIVEGVVVREH